MENALKKKTKKATKKAVKKPKTHLMPDGTRMKGATHATRY